MWRGITAGGSSGEPEDAAHSTARTDDSRTSGVVPDFDK